LVSEQQAVSDSIPWISALTGGFAGAVLTQVVQWFLGWWRRPILELSFSEDTSGCVVETPGHLTRRHGDQTIIVATSRYRYLRLRIRNRGVSSARNVNVCVTRISYSAPGAGDNEFAEEVFDLRLGMRGDTVFNLAAGAHQFMDLVYTAVHTRVASADTAIQIPQPPAGCDAVYWFDFKQSPDRLIERGFLRGRYSASVFASAENAESIQTTIRWRWNGALNELNIQPEAANPGHY
jgi:hypothetical protein